MNEECRGTKGMYVFIISLWDASVFHHSSLSLCSSSLSKHIQDGNFVMELCVVLVFALSLIILQSPEKIFYSDTEFVRHNRWISSKGRTASSRMNDNLSLFFLLSPFA